MRVVITIALAVLFIFQELTIINQNNTIQSQSHYLNTCNDQFNEMNEIANTYRDAYLKANTRLKQWDSMAPFLINLSGVKIK